LKPWIENLISSVRTFKTIKTRHFQKTSCYWLVCSTAQHKAVLY